MGMFLSKYEMLSALGYGRDDLNFSEAKDLLSGFKLFGLVLHDPEAHPDFHREVRHSFRRLDYVTGSDFLFLALTDPTEDMHRKIRNRDYSRLWESDSTGDGNITAYSIAQALDIDFDDLPAIILTKDFRFKEFQVIRTNPESIEEQMTEIGYFSSNISGTFSLEDVSFQELVKSINKEGDSYFLSGDRPLAKVLSDFLSFKVLKTGRNQQIRIAKRQVSDVIQYFKRRKLFGEGLERLNLFMLGCLANLSERRRSQSKLSIDPRCEEESRVILKTFNKVYSLFEPFDQDVQSYVSASGQWKGKAAESRYVEDLDYSILVMSLSKILEIELNVSLVQWFRSTLGIEMPAYFKKYKRSRETYTLLPSEVLVNDPWPIDFNKRKRGNWNAPGMGETKLITKTFMMERDLPKEISSYEHLLMYWDPIHKQRNRAAHTETVSREDFKTVLHSFEGILEGRHLSQMMDLKYMLKKRNPMHYF